MASRLRTILTSLKTLVQGINGAGGYVHNLSGNDQVFIGELVRPERYPAVAVYPLGQHGAHGLQLGRFKRTQNFQIQGWTQAASDSPQERVLMACDLLDDVMTAIEADRTIGGNVYDLLFLEVSAFNGDEAGVPGFGVMVCTLQLWWHTNSGAGT